MLALASSKVLMAGLKVGPAVIELLTETSMFRLVGDYFYFKDTGAKLFIAFLHSPTTDWIN